MTFAELTGPLPLSHDDLGRVVPRQAIGVFALGQFNARGALGVVTRIGRADANLLAELKRHVGRYEAFLFALSPSPQRAFELECALHHQLRRPDPSHPKPPLGVDWTCPACRSRSAVPHADTPPLPRPIPRSDLRSPTSFPAEDLAD